MRLTTEQFITKANVIHNNKYDYSYVTYTDYLTPVVIICPKHGIFKQTPNTHIYQKSMCLLCSKYVIATKLRDTCEEFVQKAKRKHGQKYDYSQIKYIKSDIPVNIICPEHGVFKQKPIMHLGYDAPCCRYEKVSLKLRHSLDIFINKANTIHNNRYDYSSVLYKNTYTKVNINCPVHGIFKQTPDSHIAGKAECPSCNKSQLYSKSSIEWLNSIMEKENIFVQHAVNIGEYVIPDLQIKVDGYCKETNTIYEFYGDYWHGNPAVYKQNHKLLGKTAGQLYTRTLKKENNIKKLGYNFVSIWEKDYNNIKTRSKMRA
ncbi:MAG: hypothetical protein ACREAU_04425 [Nitrosopumilaceae archaeon]